MTGQETFEFAAAVAGVSIGLAAVLILSIVAIVGVWQVSRRAGEASQATARAAAGIEELARHISSQLTLIPRGEAAGQQAPAREQLAELGEHERRLEELAQRLLDAVALEGGPPEAAVDELRAAVGRLDATVGQMAANLANYLAREGRP